MHIKKGDQVKIIKGKDRGKSGPVTAVFTKEGKIIVEKLNMYKKRIRPKKQGEKGETVLVPRPFTVSSAMIICKNCNEITRTGNRKNKETKERYCKKCEATI